MPFKKIPRKKKPKATAEQLNIYREIASEDTNLIIHADAGTGKTYSCIESMRRDRGFTGKRGIAAFSSTDGKKLKKDVPFGTDAGTLHSFMLRTLFEAFPKTEVNLSRTYDMVKERYPYKKVRWKRGEQRSLKRLISLCKGDGITLDDLESEHRADTFIRRIAAFHGIDLGRLVPMVIEILRESATPESLERTGIEFDDMLWMPYLHHVTPKVLYDLLYLDELQDLNVIQHANALSLATRIVGVGDERQGMYLFRGAMLHSMDQFKTDLEDRGGFVQELPLTTCWRCPASVIELAQKIVPTIQAAPNAIEGTVEELPTDDTFFRLLSGGDMVLCRVNAPLVDFVLRAWARSIPAYIQGRKDFGAVLVNIIEEESWDTSYMPSLRSKVRERKMREVMAARSLSDQESERVIGQIEDRYERLSLLMDKVVSVGDLKEILSRLFSELDQKDKVRASTVHRAKGLEADNVFILRPDLMPHYLASTEWEMDQEYNAIYVAVTRCKKSLRFIGSMPGILRG